MSDSTLVRRLTQFSHGAGCACKLAPGDLAQVLRTLTPQSHPDLLVGTSAAIDTEPGSAMTAALRSAATGLSTELGFVQTREDA